MKSELAQALDAARVRVRTALAVPVRVALHVARLSRLDAPPSEQARMHRVAVVDRIFATKPSNARVHVVFPLGLRVVARGVRRVLDVAVVSRLTGGGECEEECENEVVEHCFDCFDKVLKSTATAAGRKKKWSIDTNTAPTESADRPPLHRTRHTDHTHQAGHISIHNRPRQRLR